MRENGALTKAMGLDYLFSDRADFAAMATRESAPSKVGLIKQETRIELDEKGVKAAAVTLIGGIERTSINVDVPEFDMVIDRPFVFAIADKATGTLLFVGTVVNP